MFGGLRDVADFIISHEQAQQNRDCKIFIYFWFGCSLGMDFLPEFFLSVQYFHVYIFVYYVSSLLKIYLPLSYLLMKTPIQRIINHFFDETIYWPKIWTKNRGFHLKCTFSKINIDLPTHS